MSTTLITGATGFIGQKVARRLIAKGDSVRVIARRPDALAPDIRARVQIVCGDICDASCVERAVAGSQTVYHLAGCARAWTRDPAEFRAVNVDAVDLLLNLATRHNVQRLVHVSTILTLLDRNRMERKETLYELTKREGERIAESCSVAVIVHPTRVYGPGPLNDANGGTRLMSLYLSGALRVLLEDGDVRGNYVYVDDVADGMLLAADRGQAGAHYLLGGENASLRELLQTLARVSGVHHRVLRVNPKLGIAAACAFELWGRCGGTVPITSDWVRLFLEDQSADSTYARTRIGYAPRSLEQGVRDTVGWLLNQKRRCA